MGLSLKTTSGKVLASVALVATAASVAGLGTYGAFTSATAATANVAAGTMAIAIGDASNRLSVAAAGLIPGDTVQRAVTLSNSGTVNLAGVSLTTAATKTSKLDTDAASGLQLVIDSCSVPWTEGGTSPAFTYTCTGTTAPVLTTRSAIGANLALANLASVTAGKSDNLRVTTTLPSTADNSFQGLSSTLGFTFTATQRSAANQ
ncbi:MAG: TasA family protein [Actinomycetales bacterium]|jgi:hypothetical protein